MAYNGVQRSQIAFGYNGVQQRSERSLGAQLQFLGLQSWSSGVQSECSSGILRVQSERNLVAWECNLSAVVVFWSAA
jgi:hypothetical protein